MCVCKIGFEGKDGETGEVLKCARLKISRSEMPIPWMKSRSLGCNCTGSVDANITWQLLGCLLDV